MDAQNMSETLQPDRPTARPVWQSVKRGLRGRCPECGRGHMFRRYVSVFDVCGSCGLRLDGHRADDAPPYVTMLIVAHLLVPVLVTYQVAFTPSLTAILVMGISLTVVFSLALLPRIKGALIAVQWAKHMHGFGSEPDIAPTITT